MIASVAYLSRVLVKTRDENELFLQKCIFFLRIFPLECHNRYSRCQYWHQQRFSDLNEPVIIIHEIQGRTSTRQYSSEAVD